MDPERLEIVIEVDQLSDEIWNEVITWKFFEKDTLGKQLVRSADSISANIYEASGRYSFADRKRFAIIARGSLYETVNWLKKSGRRGLIDEKVVTRMLAEINTLSKRLNAFINTLK